MTTHDIETRHGKMRVFAEDLWVSRSLLELGEYSEDEYLFLREIIQTLSSRGGPIEMVEAGAYIGDLTIPLARIVKHLYAFEPQEEVREVLEYNLEVNRIKNVTVYPYALGAETGTTYYNVATGENAGGTLMEATGCPRKDGERKEVQVVTLDSLNLSPSLIKADIEGMEKDLIMGGLQTLRSTRCPLFVEFDAVVFENTPPLYEILNNLGYTVFAHFFPFWRELNWKKAKINPFGSVVSKMFYAIPPIE
jgi:FkbM family methyltransferase